MVAVEALLLDSLRRSLRETGRHDDDHPEPGLNASPGRPDCLATRYFAGSAYACISPGIFFLPRGVDVFGWMRERAQARRPEG
jgi:hypothetical protein